LRKFPDTKVPAFVDVLRRHDFDQPAGRSDTTRGEFSAVSAHDRDNGHSVATGSRQ
jgi:hypothetical protein